MVEESHWSHIVYPGQKGGYEVSAGEKGKAYDGILRTGGLDKCIAIGALNTSEGIGYLKHIAGYQEEPEDFAREIDDFLNDIGNENEEDDLQYLLAGSNFDRQDIELSSVDEENTNLRDIQNIAGQRMIAEELVNTRVDNYDTAWGSDEGFTSELIVDMTDLPSFVYNRRLDIHDDGHNL